MGNVKGWRICLLMIIILVWLAVCVAVLHLAPQIPLIAATLLLGVFARWHGVSWSVLEQGLVKGITKGLIPVMILLLIGLLAGVWIASGTVPFLIYEGFELISPGWFLITALIAAMAVSSFTGSSFTTIATVGAALMGIGAGFGISPALCAGAVISGACFGDKMSPLSDTTNFAPAVAGVDIFTHIRNMMWTTVPAILVTAVFFWVTGSAQAENVDFAAISKATSVLQDHFNLTLLTMVSPVIVLAAALKKWPILPVLCLGLFTGVLTALFLQPGMSFTKLMTTMQSGFTLKTDSEIVNQMINRGGLESMLFSVSLIILALAFGGIAREIGLIERFIAAITGILNKKGHFVTAAGLSSIMVNFVTGEQYLSILLPGEAFRDVYKSKRIPPETLSRTLEDCGTLVNPLVPWGVSGAFFASTLGVSVLNYIPFALFLWISPVLTFIFAYLPVIRSRFLNEEQKERIAS